MRLTRSSMIVEAAPKTLLSTKMDIDGEEITIKEEPLSDNDEVDERSSSSEGLCEH